MIAQVKCSYADLYIDDNLSDGFLKTKTKFKTMQYIGTLSGVYKTHKGKDYLQLATVNGLKQTNYFWVKKVAVNIIDNSEESTDNSEESTDYSENKPKKDYSKLLLLASLLLLGD